MLPIVRGLEKEYAGRIDFVRVNILNPNNAAIVREFGFSTTPELYLVDASGRVVRFWDGKVEPDELREAFDSALK